MPKVRALGAYEAKYTLCGWVGPEIAREAYQEVCGNMPVFKSLSSVNDYKDQRQMLWEFTRKVLGKDTENFPQATGDCVSFAGKNVIEYLQCVEIALNEDMEAFHPIFPPYFYGTSRIQVGKGRLGYQAGSCGSWLQEAIKRYGTLRRNEEGVPPYSGGLAQQWGTRGVPQEFIPKGQQHLIKTTALITTAEDVAASLLAGYPVAVCSNQGFAMTPDADGFHKPRGSWGHAMTIIGFEDHPQYGLYFIILNSWGDVHGQLKDFKTGENLPIGTLRVKADVVHSMVAQQDSFSYSQFDGFPDNSDKLHKNLFNLVGE